MKNPVCACGHQLFTHVLLARLRVILSLLRKERKAWCSKSFNWECAALWSLWNMRAAHCDRKLYDDAFWDGGEACFQGGSALVLRLQTVYTLSTMEHRSCSTFGQVSFFIKRCLGPFPLSNKTRNSCVLCRLPFLLSYRISPCPRFKLWTKVHYTDHATILLWMAV